MFTNLKCYQMIVKHNAAIVFGFKESALHNKHIWGYNPFPLNRTVVLTQYVSISYMSLGLKALTFARKELHKVLRGNLHLCKELYWRQTKAERGAVFCFLFFFLTMLSGWVPGLIFRHGSVCSWCLFIIDVRAAFGVWAQTCKTLRGLRQNKAGAD